MEIKNEEASVLSWIDSDQDFYDSDTNEAYKNTYPYPLIDCPQEEKAYNPSSNKGRFEYVKTNQEIVSISHMNSNFINDLEDLTENLATHDQINKYKISFGSEDKYLYEETFFDKDKRMKILNLTRTLDPSSSIFQTAKQRTNPFEKVFEQQAFIRKSSIQLANVNQLFGFKLLEANYVSGFTNCFVFGDDGGYNDYLLGLSHKKGLSTRVYNIFPMLSKFLAVSNVKNSIAQCGQKQTLSESDTRSLIINIDNSSGASEFDGNDQDNNSNIDKDKEFSLNVFNLDNSVQQNLDDSSTLDKIPSLLKTLSNYFLQQDQPVGLYIAKKKLTCFNSANENDSKLYLLFNAILALNILDNDGNFLIKLQETYTKFTVSIIYVLYSCFNSISLFKPYSSHQCTASRYLFCRGLNTSLVKEHTINKLNSLLESYVEIRKQGCDIESVFNVWGLIGLTGSTALTGFSNYYKSGSNSFGISNNILSTGSGIGSGFVGKDPEFHKYYLEMMKDIDEKRISKIQEIKLLIEQDKCLSYHKLNLKKELLELWEIDISEIERQRLIVESKLEEKKRNPEKQNNKLIGKIVVDETYDQTNGKLGELMNIFDKERRQIPNRAEKKKRKDEKENRIEIDRQDKELKKQQIFNKYFEKDNKLLTKKKKN